MYMGRVGTYHVVLEGSLELESTSKRAPENQWYIRSHESMVMLWRINIHIHKPIVTLDHEISILRQLLGPQVRATSDSNR